MISYHQLLLIVLLNVSVLRWFGIEGKTKYMLSTSRDVRRIDSRIMADNYNFDTVEEFIYLGSAVTTQNDVSLEIKRRITFANR